MEDKIIRLLDYLKSKGVELTGDTALVCNDGALLVTLNADESVDLHFCKTMRNLDFNLGITDEDIEKFKVAESVEDVLSKMAEEVL